MGTYYRIANLDAREFVCPHRVSDRQGAKLRELAGGDAAAVLVALLAGDWKGARVALLSDGADSGEWDSMGDCEDGSCAHAAVRASPELAASWVSHGLDARCWRDVTPAAVEAAREQGLLE